LGDHSVPDVWYVAIVGVMAILYASPMVGAFILALFQREIRLQSKTYMTRAEGENTCQALSLLGCISKDTFVIPSQRKC